MATSLPLASLVWALAGLGLAGSSRAGRTHAAPRHARSAVLTRPVRMEAPHPWSAPTASSKGWAAENEPLQALPAEVLPSPRRSPLDVIKLVLGALRHPNEPYEDYGAQLAIAHSAPSNGASQLAPVQFAKYLAEESYVIFSEWDEMEIEDALKLSDDGKRAYQEVLVRRADDPDWTHINWTLVQHAGMWMTESVVTF